MKPTLLFLILALSVMNLFSQNKTTLKFIFIPHPRTEDNVNQSVIPLIAKIDFSNFDLKMLGGDITYSTSKNNATLTYVDNLFDLRNPNTLWSFGNHDVESGNRSLIKQFTGRESYYSYNRDGITFIVLDTELDATGFSRTFIKGDQLQLVKNVCDTISNSRFLILLHSRFIWMINNDYFKNRLTDSIAASSRSMNTTNFYADIYPLLQKVKAKGIQVHVFGGDKSKINVTYSPEDSITFHAARMAPELADSENNVIIINYNLQNKTLICNYVPLNQVNESNQDTTVTFNQTLSEQQALRVWQTPGSDKINLQLQSRNNDNVLIHIYSINGELCRTVHCKANEIQSVNLFKPGTYIANVFDGHSIRIKKFILQ